MKFQVYIEGCRDNTPRAVESLSQAIASTYGIAAEQIVSRVAKGRFRIKTGMTLPEAKAFMGYLESEGALCSIIDGTGIAIARSPRARTSLVQAPVPIELESPEMLTLETSPPDRTSHAEAPPVQTTGFGAMQLSTIDGVNSSGKPEADVNDNAFLPPDMVQEEEKLEVEMPLPRRPSSQRTAAANSALVSEEAFVTFKGKRSSDVENTASSDKEGPLEFLANHMRPRFALGVALSLLLGFVIMTPIASSREASRYEQPLTELEADYEDADSLLAWNNLDAQVSDTIASLTSRRTSIIVTSLLIWLAISGVFAFLWFRMFPWIRWENSR